MKEQTMWWKFTMVYNPGKTQNAADALSQSKPLHPLYVAMAEEDSDERDMMEVGSETIGVAMLAANVQDGAEMV